MTADTTALVERFWRLMASNRFETVGVLLADDFRLDWPQSGERIRGRERFAGMNAEYPAHGPWTFEVQRIIGDPSSAVSEVLVSDGVQHGRAISFFEIHAGLIRRIVEFWPEPFAARADRAHWVERID